MCTLGSEQTETQTHIIWQRSQESSGKEGSPAVISAVWTTKQNVSI